MTQATHLNAAITLENNLKKDYEQTAETIRTAEANKQAAIETAQAKYDEIIAEETVVYLQLTCK